MTDLGRALLQWSPRVLCLGFACFLGVFALDVFTEGHTRLELIRALLIHLIPTGLMLATLAVAWHWPWAGTALCAGLGILYIVQSGGRLHWSNYVVIPGSLFLIATLFLLDWLYRVRVRPAG